MKFLAQAKDSTIERLEGALNAHTAEIQRLETNLDQCHEGLASKANELRKLHALVLQSQQSSEPPNNEDIRAKLNSLEGQIVNLMKKEFLKTKGRTGWRDFDDIEALDDRDFFLQADIANTIAKLLFAPALKVFGLDSNLDHALGEIENRLEQLPGK